MDCACVALLVVNCLLYRAAVPLKDTAMRMPVFTKSVALPIQVANASQMSSLANPAATKPSMNTVLISAQKLSLH